MLRPASGRNTDRLYSNPAFFMCSAMMLFATWTLIAQACAFPAAFGDCLSTECRGDTAPNEFCNSVASLFLNWDCDSGEKFKLGTSLGTLDWPWENRGCLYHAATCKDVFWARRLTSQAWPFSLSTREVVPDSFNFLNLLFYLEHTNKSLFPCPPLFILLTRHLPNEAHPNRVKKGSTQVSSCICHICVNSHIFCDLGFDKEAEWFQTSN